MDIISKFEKGALSKTYQRIDSEYKVDIYLGYNEDGQMSMAIIENGVPSRVQSSKMIEVTLSKREKGEMILQFDLLDVAYKSLFIVFCKDIISICEKAGSSMAISNALTRWKYWKEMFEKKKQNIMDKQTIKGLVGELLILKNYLWKEYGETKAISSWMGPLLGHKDFEIDNTWYEVKSLNENSILVNISSLEQLDSEVDGNLVVVRLEDTSPTNNNSINLFNLILEIQGLIEDPDNRELFWGKLDNLGFSFDNEYKLYCFIYRGCEYYSVNEKFPKLLRSKIDSAIGNASYTILLNEIKQFRKE